MSDVDVNKIANIIADIQTSQEKLEESEQKIVKLNDELNSEEEYADDERQAIQSLRQELDEYLNELIPGTASKLVSFDNY